MNKKALAAALRQARTPHAAVVGNLPGTEWAVIPLAESPLAQDSPDFRPMLTAPILQPPLPAAPAHHLPFYPEHAVLVSGGDAPTTVATLFVGVAIRAEDAGQQLSIGFIATNNRSSRWLPGFVYCPRRAEDFDIIAGNISFAAYKAWDCYARHLHPADFQRMSAHRKEMTL